ncbi:MAG TPA: hypothetical protein VGN72_17710 [Tepidisphaeraceae bacterium]|jgi:hypothetical protein|nr:hypothetical protein [Tepidisphaeraceae bacterium]
MNADEARAITLEALHAANPWLEPMMRPAHAAIKAAAARAQQRAVRDPTPADVPDDRRMTVHIALRLEGYSVLADVLEGDEIGMADTFTISW